MSSAGEREGVRRVRDGMIGEHNRGSGRRGTYGVGEGRARASLVRHRWRVNRRGDGWGAERGGEVGERARGKAEGGEKPQRRRGAGC